MKSLGRVLMIFTVLLIISVVAEAAVPRAAERYRDDLTRQCRFLWGINCPVATLAAQIHQESMWRAHARSAYALGLTQFTPDTVRWIAGAYPRELADADALNPAWAIKALVIYDLHLWLRIKSTRSNCDRAAMMLSGYNGGPGWVTRDRMLAEQYGADPTRWFGSVEHYTQRAPAAKRENRDYPRKILLRWQSIYNEWGAGIRCVLA